MTPDASGFLPVARELALEAGARVMALQKDPLQKTRKSDNSLVTNADHAANDILRHGLLKAFPDHAVISEETGREGSPAAEWVWLIDPLDGTKAYAKNVTGFSVMVGLLYGEKPVLGVVFDPREDNYYEAVRGKGAFHLHAGEKSRVKVSKRDQWKDMPVIVSTGFSAPLQKRLRQAVASPFLEPVNSVGVKVGYLARQAADIYINHHPINFWDSCGPLVILEEAGGVMTLWDGTPLAYNLAGPHRHPGPTLATNGPRHKELLALLNEK